MTIETMKPSHVSQIAALEARCFSAPWDEGSLAAELENPLALWLVAAEGDRVLGYVGSQTVLGESDMMNLAVHPDYRRQGIAEKLVTALISTLAEQGSRCLTLEVRTSNTAAKALYGKLGFSQVGCRKNYYSKPKEDGDILRKEWNP